MRESVGAAEDGHGAGEGAGPPAEVMGEAEVSLPQLAGAGLALELLVDLVDHSDAAGSNGVAEALEAAVGVYGKVALEGKSAGLHVPAAGATATETQVLVDDELGDGEAVVDHGKVDFFPGTGDAGFLVGGLAGAGCLRENG